MKKVVMKISKSQIKKGDTVKVLSGKDRGKQGRVLALDYKKNKATVEGVNMAKKAVRPTQENQKGGIVDVALAIHLSNIQLVCPKCNKPTKVGRKLVNDKRVRICKNSKCNEIIDKV
jgi:large subunit ribosomal protein L24